MSDSLTLLLLSDIHCSGNRRFTFGRFTGEAHTTQELRPRLTDLLTRYQGAADYVFISGDTTDHGFEDEYAGFLSMIQGFDPAWFCMAPGNHDISNVNSRNLRADAMPRFKNTLRALLPPHPQPLDSDAYFPWVRDLGRGFAAIGLDSTLEKTATGRIGPRQMQRLAEFLSSREFADHHKIILLHHDVTGDTDYFSGYEIPYGNGLTDREELIALLADHNQRSGRRDVTIISGHTHHKRVDIHALPGVNYVNTPSFGSRFEHDYIAIELTRGGALRDLTAQAPPGRVRRLKKLARVFIPKMKT